jgi:hypothetical protein
MKYAVEMGSGAMICIPSFVKTYRHTENKVDLVRIKSTVKRQSYPCNRPIGL